MTPLMFAIIHQGMWDCWNGDDEAYLWLSSTGVRWLYILGLDWVLMYDWLIARPMPVSRLPLMSAIEYYNAEVLLCET